MSTVLAPVLYLPHGGGPMPLLDDPAHGELIAFLKGLAGQFARPDAIVLVSAHWEERVPSVYADAAPGMLFDYYGFPPETYRFTYPAPGNPALATRIATLLQEQGLNCKHTEGRGFDHGTFVPMLLVYPDGDIPMVQLSLLEGLDAGAHLRLGKALQQLRRENVAIIGSGMSFHNLRAIFAGPRPDLQQASSAFADWLLQTMTDASVTAQERLQALSQWQDAPYATFCHPRAEHLLPLHVCAGAAGGLAATSLFDAPLMGHRVNGFGWFQ
jgi:4,5-DOPA dioxygenase extradiol